MTVSYTGDVANASSFGCFNKILFKWKGSVYKLIYKELLAYITLYYIINLIYREVLVKKSECEVSTSEVECDKWKASREAFEALRTYCNEQLTSIPLTFVLGFYVSLIVNRWWTQYNLLPWPDAIAMYTLGFLTGKEERQRIMRRNIVRYVLLSYCMAMRTVSFRVKKRFPDLQHLVDAGLMRPDELKVIQNHDLKVTANKWFLPLAWASDICARALAEGKIKPQTVKALLSELVHIRENLTGIINHDWVSVPLVYTQVVTLAVYSYFCAALIGAQWINPESNKAYKTAYNLPTGPTGTRLDLYYPIFLTVQFIFFFGWLKVAETLINPFGEDDDDFELNRLIDRHCQVGYLIIEQETIPELMKDHYWDDSIPKEIPYTIAAEKFKKEEFQGSAERTLQIKDCDKEYGYVYSNRKYGNRSISSTTYGAAHPERGDTAHHSDSADGEYAYGEYGDYESVGTPFGAARFSWIKKKKSRLESVASMRSNRSVSSSSTYFGHNLDRKSQHRSQLSLYEKIRKMSGIDSREKHEARSRKSSKLSQKEKIYAANEILKMQQEQEEQEGVANESYEKNEDELQSEFDEDDYRRYILDKKLLDTIAENQNSPYSTRASHNNSRRVSMQSLFPETDRRRGSLLKERVLELFHENEEEVRSKSRTSWIGEHGEEEEEERVKESLSGSHRSQESGVGSIGSISGDLDLDPLKTPGLDRRGSDTSEEGAQETGTGKTRRKLAKQESILTSLSLRSDIASPASAKKVHLDSGPSSPLPQPRRLGTGVESPSAQPRRLLEAGLRTPITHPRRMEVGIETPGTQRRRPEKVKPSGPPITGTTRAKIPPTLDGSPSPSIPRRRPLMSYNSIEEMQSPKIQQKHPPVTTPSVEKRNLSPVTQPSVESDSVKIEKNLSEKKETGEKNGDDNIDSLFDTHGTVYV